MSNTNDNSNDNEIWKKILICGAVYVMASIIMVCLKTNYEWEWIKNLETYVAPGITLFVFLFTTLNATKKTNG